MSAFTKVRSLSTTGQYLLLAPLSSLRHMTSWAESDLRKAIHADEFWLLFLTIARLFRASPKLQGQGTALNVLALKLVTL